VKRAARQRGFLLFGVALLLALALAQYRRDQAAAPATLLMSDPASITHVELRLQHAPVEHYARREGHWWRTDGTPARADDGRLDELTEIAQAPVLGWRPARDFDPAKIGLQPPLAALRLDGQTLEFGETSATGPQRYVRVGARVALVSVRYTPRPRMDATTRAP
jgi:hypothetical protein